MAIDPVCKMTVDEETAEFTSEYKGETFYFCAAGCKNAFEEEPEKYLAEWPPETVAESHEMPGASADKKPWWKFNLN